MPRLRFFFAFAGLCLLTALRTNATPTTLFFPLQNPDTGDYDAVDTVDSPIQWDADPFDPPESGQYGQVVIGFKFDPTAGPDAQPFPNYAPISTTVDVVDGGDILPPAVLYSDSALTVGGTGIVSRVLYSYDHSLIKMTNGSMSDIYANDKTDVEISGGTAGAVGAFDNAQIIITGGSVVNAGAINNGTLKMTGGTAGSIGMGDSSTATLGGAAGQMVTVSGALITSRNSSVIVNKDTSIGGDITTNDESKVRMTGGSVAGNLFAYNNSYIDIAGGVVNGYGEAHDSSFIYVEGGTVLGNGAPSGVPVVQLAASDSQSNPADDPGLVALTAFDFGTIDFIGTDLQSSLVNSDNQDMFSEYQITGLLSDGTPISTLIDIQNNGTAGFEFNAAIVPEPASFAVMAASLFPIFLRRRYGKAMEF